MRENLSFVRSPDNVVEIRVSDGNGVILSHINYTLLERVRRTRARLKFAHDDAQLSDASTARSA